MSGRQRVLFPGRLYRLCRYGTSSALPGSRSAAADIDPRSHAFFTDQHRAAGSCLGILHLADSDSITILLDPKLKNILRQSKAACAVVPKGFSESGGIALIQVEDVNSAFNIIASFSGLRAVI